MTVGLLIVGLVFGMLFAMLAWGIFESYKISVGVSIVVFLLIVNYEWFFMFGRILTSIMNYRLW